MQVDVHMRDGRTVHRVARRALVAELLRRDPKKIQDHRPIEVETCRHPQGEFEKAHLLVLQPPSVAFIETART
jgi:hypothetical protein